MFEPRVVREEIRFFSIFIYFILYFGSEFFSVPAFWPKRKRSPENYAAILLSETKDQNVRLNLITSLRHGHNAGEIHQREIG